VQRQTWTVKAEDLIPAAIPVFRSIWSSQSKNCGPRKICRALFIFVDRTSFAASGAEGRDKDTKPVFVDLESYLFLEIFHRWLMKAGRLKLTEMCLRPKIYFGKNRMAGAASSCAHKLSRAHENCRDR